MTRPWPSQTSTSPNLQELPRRLWPGRPAAPARCRAQGRRPGATANARGRRTHSASGARFPLRRGAQALDTRPHRLCIRGTTRRSGRRGRGGGRGIVCRSPLTQLRTLRRLSHGRRAARPSANVRSAKASATIAKPAQCYARSSSRQVSYRVARARRSIFPVFLLWRLIGVRRLAVLFGLKKAWQICRERR